MAKDIVDGLGHVGQRAVLFTEALPVCSRVAIVITILAEKESFQMETEAEEGEGESNLSIHSVSF